MPRNRQQIPKAEREAALVDHAWELFATRGYKGTSLAEVGRAAGVAANAVRWYFPTKDDLFAAALDHYVTQVRERIEADEELAGDPQRELVALLLDMEPYRGCTGRPTNGSATRRRSPQRTGRSRSGSKGACWPPSPADCRPTPMSA
ncbi:TetR/AcrR family transcriptional regulator [Streptomyces sanglieri]|uniref:TetR/AcrR family transcriptional regulator n=1 Tax=Streptomyces sanglieri TaxID=193460 RepID=A0ABW2WUH0_9ACTN